MAGTPFMERRRLDMVATFKRHAALSDALADLEGRGPFMRAYYLPQMLDARIASAAWDVYQPAVPLNFAGVVFAAAGFLVAAVGLGLALRMVAALFRRRKGRPLRTKIR